MSTENSPTPTPEPSSGHPKWQKFGNPPFWMVAWFLIFIVASWLPLAYFARARVSTSPVPRIQLFQDMGVQPKYREQAANYLFADDRADRPVIPGTVARQDLDLDDHYYRGYTRKWDEKTQKFDVTYFNDFPEQVKLTPALLKRGQDRFIIYCTPCHGIDGAGHGSVNDRAIAIGSPSWVPAANLHDAAIRNRPAGHIFNSITNGIRNMPPYAAQIPVADRWAIVAYVRALQLTQDAPASVLSADELRKLP
jgi:mono/diheme cytochrome c family protein